MSEEIKRIKNNNIGPTPRGLASGIYIVQLYAEEGKKVYQQKLVVQ